MEKQDTLSRIDSLLIPDAIKKDLGEFISQTISFYKQDLLSIIAFGSAVTGDYSEKSSDVNLLVVYNDLNIVDLNLVAGLAKKWLQKRNFSPRFISRRNFISSSKFFQIDMLEMKDAHILLCGDDLLNSVVVNEKYLHWQLSYEIKAMRTRIKQQFWATTGDAIRVRRVLLERFTSIIHHSRALLFLMKKEAPVSHVKIMENAEKELGISKDFIGMMFKVKKDEMKLDEKEGIHSFTQIMEVIRILDKAVDEINL